MAKPTSPLWGVLRQSHQHPATLPTHTQGPFERPGPLASTNWWTLADEGITRLMLPWSSGDLSVGVCVPVR